MDESKSTVLDISAIEKILPHRPPFLLLDRVVEMSADKIVAIKNVTMNEPFFVGHFPGHPVMPGVLIVEALAQAAAVLALWQAEGKMQGVYLAAVESAKFRKPVTPGDQLRLEVTPLRRGSTFWKFAGNAIVDGVPVAEAQFLAATTGQ